MRSVRTLLLGAIAGVGIFSGAIAQGSDVMSLTPEQREKFATVINLNGQLCARVLEVRKRESSTYYVECETHKSSLARKAYTVDLKTGKAS